MIKEYTSTVKAEVFDGSEEMAKRYPIRYFPKSDWLNEHWILDVPHYDFDEFDYPENLMKGEVLITFPSGIVDHMMPYQFKRMFNEVDK